MLEIIKKHPVIVALTLITVLELIVLKKIDVSLVLWIGYGVYKFLSQDQI